MSVAINVPRDRRPAIESQVHRLTRSMQDLMFAVKRTADDIASIKRRADSEEWSDRFASLQESDFDRLQADFESLRRDVETLRTPSKRSA
jgi:predicted RNase H-like nuclease (RuvC/YqgF family)